MDKLIDRLPDIINAAAQSQLGILALLSIALSVLAYFFFAKAAVKVRVWIFVLLFLGVFGFGVAMFRVSPGTSGAAPPVASERPLSAEAKTLLAEAAADPSGLVVFERYGEGVDLHSNGVSLFTDKANHKGLATWEYAIDELIKQELLIPLGDRRELFEITKKGYDAAAGFE